MGRIHLLRTKLFPPRFLQRKQTIFRTALLALACFSLLSQTPAGAAANGSSGTLASTRTPTHTPASRTRTPTPSATNAAPSATSVPSTSLPTPPLVQGTGPVQIYLSLIADGNNTVGVGASSPPTPSASDTPVPTGDLQPGFPIRAAFYYPWYPQAWTQNKIYPYTRYHPDLGFYASDDLTVIRQHIQEMQYAHIQAGIASWWGQGQHTDLAIPDLLAASAGSSFRWALYYEPEGQGDPTVPQIQSDLVYIRDHYGMDPSYLRVDGRFVVFVYGLNENCTLADRWVAANAGINAYIVLKTFLGSDTCASQPDAWHSYAAAHAMVTVGADSVSISPGFWPANPKLKTFLTRDLAQWNADIQAMAAAPVKFQLILTFNEWGEGSAVEPAQEWASPSGFGLYLDALHNQGQ